MRFFLFGLGHLVFDDLFFFCHLRLSEIESSWKLCGFDTVFLDFFRFFFGYLAHSSWSFVARRSTVWSIVMGREVCAPPFVLHVCVCVCGWKWTREMSPFHAHMLCCLSKPIFFFFFFCPLIVKWAQDMR